MFVPTFYVIFLSVYGLVFVCEYTLDNNIEYLLLFASSLHKEQANIKATKIV